MLYLIIYATKGVGNSGIDPAWIALIGTILGTIGLKVAEHFLGRGRVKIDDAKTIRDELRQQVTELRNEVRQQEQEADRWKKDYYDLRDKYAELNAALMMAKEGKKDQ